LKENDKSIKQAALDLTYLITNEGNVKSIVKELLNHLISVNEIENDFLEELTNKVKNNYFILFNFIKLIDL
jgi:hypothetical protein